MLCSAKLAFFFSLQQIFSMECRSQHCECQAGAWMSGGCLNITRVFTSWAGVWMSISVLDLHTPSFKQQYLLTYYLFFSTRGHFVFWIFVHKKRSGIPVFFVVLWRPSIPALLNAKMATRFLSTLLIAKMAARFLNTLPNAKTATRFWNTYDFCASHIHLSYSIFYYIFMIQRY